MKAVLITGPIAELMCSEMKNECCCYNVLFTVIINSTSVTKGPETHLLDPLTSTLHYLSNQSCQVT